MIRKNRLLLSALICVSASAVFAQTGPKSLPEIRSQADFDKISVVYDANGQLLTASFMDYAMPRAGLVEGIKLVDHPVPTKLNPLGAKGVGEAGVTGSMPALMNAVVDALRQAGIQSFEMPASPARVWKALQKKT